MHVITETDNFKSHDKTLFDDWTFPSYVPFNEYWYSKDRSLLASTPLFPIGDLHEGYDPNDKSKPVPPPSYVHSQIFVTAKKAIEYNVVVLARIFGIGVSFGDMTIPSLHFHPATNLDVSGHIHFRYSEGII